MSEAAVGSVTDGGVTAPASAGALLKAARERQGVHLAVLAASLKVTQRKLELLEADRHGELPGPAFVRALALSMCRALKIDPEPVLAQLPRQGDQVLDHVAQSLNQPFRDRGAPSEPGEWPRWLSLPVIGAALLVAAAALVYVLPVGFWSSLRPVAGEAPAAAGPTPAPATPAAGPASAPAAAAPAAVAASAADAAPALVTAEPAAVPAEPPSPSASAVIDTVFLAPKGEAAPAATGSVLSLRTTAESWVEVRDRNGQVLLSRTLAAGESAGLDGTPPFKLTVGNASATELQFRGKPVPLTAGRDNVARLELK